MGKALKNLENKKVVIDTSPIIYYMEEDTEYLDILEEFFIMVDNGEIEGVVSVITLLETLVRPLKENDFALAEDYRRILTESRNMELVDINPKIAEKAAEIRSKYGTLLPDAIQAAVTINHKADFLLTNDKGFSKIREMRSLILSEMI